ncbi:hypothetical protein C1H46_009485 [Malus baccata]|uniref:Dirigent protein n=1 Tax=Malus baccata TaxID=106549 RepID=A0A540N1F0_MALBA|nr:hypothetical protein C1H46_009485 [Malus baccata]
MAKSIRPLKATLYILLVAITLGFSSSARILDEVKPNESNPLPTTVPAMNPLPIGQIPTVAPTTITVDDTVDDADSPIPETDDTPPKAEVVPPVVPPVTTVSQANSPLPETDDEPSVVPTPIADAAPVATPAIPVATPMAGPVATTPNDLTAAAASAIVAKPDAETPHLSFFMHDILGGSHPSVRVVIGLVATTVLNVAFSNPNNNIFPVSGETPLTNNNINGFLNNNKNNIPNIAGLSGLTNSQSSTVIQNSGNNNIVNDGSNQPFVTAGQFPNGVTLQKLISLDGYSHTMAFTVLLHAGEHDVEDTISLFGVYRTASPVSHIAVIGRTGKYENANGYAAIESLHQEDQHTTDGVDTIMQIGVYLSE